MQTLTKLKEKGNSTLMAGDSKPPCRQWTDQLIGMLGPQASAPGAPEDTAHVRSRAYHTLSGAARSVPLQVNGHTARNTPHPV